MWEIISLIKMITLRGEGYEEGQVVPERMEQYHASKKKN